MFHIPCAHKYVNSSYVLSAESIFGCFFLFFFWSGKKKKQIKNG